MPRVLLSATQAFLHRGFTPQRKPESPGSLICDSGLPRVGSLAVPPALVTLQCLNSCFKKIIICPDFVVVFCRFNPANLLLHYWKPVFLLHAFEKPCFKNPKVWCPKSPWLMDPNKTFLQETGSAYVQPKTLVILGGKGRVSHSLQMGMLCLHIQEQPDWPTRHLSFCLWSQCQRMNWGSREFGLKESLSFPGES